MPKVKYLRNANLDEGTASVTLSKDEPLVLGGEARWITDEEYAVLVQRIIMEQVDSGDPPEPEPESDGLDDMNADELDNIADSEDIDLKGVRSNKDKVEAIRNARAGEPPEGAESLPGTATSVPPESIQPTGLGG